MLTRRGAFRQRGLDLPKIQTDIKHHVLLVEAPTPSAAEIHDAVDSDLAKFIHVDDTCLEFLTPTSGSSGGTATTTPTPGGGAGDDDDDNENPRARPMDRHIHGRSGLKRTAPDWAIKVRSTLSEDFDQDSTPVHHGRQDDNSSGPGRRPSVVDRKFSYGRKIQTGGGRRPSDFSLRLPPPGLAIHYEDTPFELVLCSEQDSLYSN